MVNYGYECKDWSADKKERLASELAKLLKPYDKLKPSPTIEVDETYPGVRMRKLTWIPEPELDELIAKADEIFDKIIKEKTADGAGPQPFFMAKVERAVANKQARIAKERGE